ncbi:hypothetical protein LAZ67_19001672 [Cordylochernes scorpioides]|uniref:CCHC-type domain-containing protein n=1 Tax=Cordylochernes scorpioides TaxID=51811 RepID=A0ABY6LI73_9ARAC|nr:hypothetical protein LAZ67_19001672 [Cordylochernes scorpioides]
MFVRQTFTRGKRAERIVLGNVLFFVEDTDLVAALRPYGQVKSMVQKMMQLEDSCWADARREACITLRDGVKLSQIPARLEVKSKGMVTHVYVTYGIKCSLCHKQGHKRANCPRKTGLQEDKLVLPIDAPAARTQGWTKPPSTSNTMPAAAPTPAEQTPPTAAVEPAPPPTPSSATAPSPEANIPVHPQETTTPEPPVPAPSTSQLPSRPEPSSTNTEPSAAPEEENQTMTDQVENMFIELNADSILAPLYDEVDDIHEVVAAVIHRSDREALPDALSYENRKILYEFLGDAIEHVGDKNPSISTGLSELRAALNI